MGHLRISPTVTIATRTTKKNGVISLRFRLRAGRNVDVYYTSGIKATISDLNRLQSDGTAKKRLNQDLWDDKKLVDKISELKTQMEAAYNNMLTEGIVVSDKNFKEEVNEEIYHIKKKREEAEKAKNKPTFYELTELFYTDEPHAECNIRSYRAFVRTICRWERYRRICGNEKFKMDLDQLTKDDIEDLREYLKNEHDLAIESPAIFDKICRNYPMGLVGNRIIQKRGESTIRKMLKRLKAILNWAQKKGYTTNNPMVAIEIGSDTSKDTPIYLSKEERNILASFDVEEAYNGLEEETRRQIGMSVATLKQQRDIFVFNCFVGARVYDLQRFTMKNIVGRELHYIPHKTLAKKRDMLKIPLSGLPYSLVVKYDGVDRKGRLFPFITDQRYNDAIKALCLMAGLTREIERVNPTTGQKEFVRLCDVASSHLARRTFVGTLYNEGVDRAVIGSMSGHSKDSEAFWRYAEPNDTQRSAAIAALE